jgi:hypothetical protein
MKRTAVRRQRPEEAEGRQREVHRRADRRGRLARVAERSAKAIPAALEESSAPPLPSAPELRPSAEPLPAAPERAAAQPQRAQSESPPRGRLITSGRLSFLVVAALLYYGLRAHTERYLSPNRGLGYALGIIGGSLMLLVLAYSLRKRWRWLEFLGSTPGWFKFHMVLGIAGPLCILYHSNFGTGATNSNVALFSMLAVAGSGVVGRYIYGHIHNGLYGRKLELRELQAEAEGVRSGSGSIGFVPELINRLESAEQRLLSAGSRLWGLGYLQPLVVAFAALKARAQLRHYARGALQAASGMRAVRAEHEHMCQRALAYVDRRLGATRRVAEFDGYERLFSLWHSLHIPLIFVMVIAAIIHVIAVLVY